MGIAANLDLIYQRIQSAATRVNRNPQEISLIAVTKYVEAGSVNEAIKAGVTIIGENRVQDGIKKFPLLVGKVSKHLIGSLQTNKVKLALAEYDLIHSVDRPELVLELAKQAERLGRRIPFLIQVNISGEATKHGLAPEVLPSLLNQVVALENLLPCGLMTIAPLMDNPEQARPIFRKLKLLFNEISAQRQFGPEWRYLSMGMSQDYEIAVEEGSNMLRIGTAIFKVE